MLRLAGKTETKPAQDDFRLLCPVGWVLSAFQFWVLSGYTVWPESGGYNDQDPNVTHDFQVLLGLYNEAQDSPPMASGADSPPNESFDDL